MIFNKTLRRKNNGKLILAISDGTFTLTETEVKKQFYFYRNDRETLTNIDRELLELYHGYVMQKMISGEITDILMNNIYSEISTDKKCIRLTICDIGEKVGSDKNSKFDKKKSNFLKRLWDKIFK